MVTEIGLRSLLQGIKCAGNGDHELELVLLLLCLVLIGAEIEDVEVVYDPTFVSVHMLLNRLYLQLIHSLTINYSATDLGWTKTAPNRFNIMSTRIGVAKKWVLIVVKSEILDLVRLVFFSWYALVFALNDADELERWHHDIVWRAGLVSELHPNLGKFLAVLKHGLGARIDDVFDHVTQGNLLVGRRQGKPGRAVNI